MSESFERDILVKLDQVIKMLAVQVSQERSTTDGVWLLKLAGLDNRTIAEVLNTSDATVRALLSNLRKQRAQSIKTK